MLFDILTLFPAMFQGIFAESIVKRAQEKGLISIHIQDIREYATDAHKTVDDYPYGGGAGMVLKPQPLADAIRTSRQRLETHHPKVVLMAAHGTRLTQQMIKDFTAEQALILLCGHYKGVDHRIEGKYVDMAVSIGDYVLSGGEIPAMVFVDAITRLLPGAIGNRDSAEGDSFYGELLGPPQYTRPEVFEDMAVPGVLLSGHHENIERWRREQAVEITRKYRPDLLGAS